MGDRWWRGLPLDRRFVQDALADLAERVEKDVEDLPHHRFAIELVDGQSGTRRRLEHAPSHAQVFVGDRVVVDVQFIGSTALMDHVREKSVVYVVVQVRDGYLDGWRFTHVELVDLEPETGAVRVRRVHKGRAKLDIYLGTIISIGSSLRSRASGFRGSQGYTAG